MATQHKEPKKEVTKHTCLCGRTAEKRMRGDWACARCLKIEEYYYGKKGPKPYRPEGGMSEYKVYEND